MYELVVIVVLGVFTGVITGLIPGIHPNTVIFGTLPFYFYFDVVFINYVSFVCGLSVAHTFHDFLPAIFLGAPESESALSTSPGLEMTGEGKGLEAFYYTVIGGMWSTVLVVVLLPWLYFAVEPVYGFLESYMEYLLLFFLLVLVFDSSDIKVSFTIAVLTGSLGLLSFSSTVNRQYILVPIFAGLFAVPTVLLSLTEKADIPHQRPARVERDQTVVGGLIGFLAGLVAGIFPGLGAAASTSFIAPLADDSRRVFLAGMGGVNTTDIIMSFLAILVIERARSGASVALKAVSEVTQTDVFFLMGAALFATGISVVIALNIAKVYLSFIKRFEFSKVLLSVLAVLVLINFYLSGFRGLLVLLVSSFIGTSAVLTSNRRVCMAVLLVPTIVFFSDTFVL